jgi:hypothetical protein
MPRNCESVSLTFEAQLSKSKVARVRADAALTADADMGNSQLRLFASADSLQPTVRSLLLAGGRVTRCGCLALRRGSGSN